MAEHDEGQRVGARRDAAAAIGDDLLFVECAGRGEFGAQRWCRQKRAVLRIDQRSRRHIDALRDAAGSAIGVAAAAGVLLTGERVDRADRAVADRRQHRFLADHQIPVLAHGEAGRRTRLARAGFGGASQSVSARNSGWANPCASLMLASLSVNSPIVDQKEKPVVPSRINRAIELLAQDQAIYYVGAHSGHVLTRAQGREDAGTWADY